MDRDTGGESGHRLKIIFLACETFLAYVPIHLQSRLTVPLSTSYATDYELRCEAASQTTRSESRHEKLVTPREASRVMPHYVEKYTPKMLFWYIEGAKYFSFDNMTLDPKAFVRSFTRTIAISHFYVWENIC